MKKLLLAISLTFALPGCSPWVVNYEARSLRQSDDRLTKTALRIPVGDLEALADAGGKPLGTMYVGANSGWMLTGGLEEVHEKAGEEAAKRGASHLLYLESSEIRGTAATANRIFDTTVISVNETSELRGARYLLIRVPEKRWKELDKALRPASLF